MFYDNRIVNAIEKAKLRLATSGKSTEELAELSGKLDLSFDEHFHFQELKSLAQLQGTLTLGEATSIYAALGKAPSVFNRQPLEVKLVVTQLFAELLKQKVAS